MRIERALVLGSLLAVSSLAACSGDSPTGADASSPDSMRRDAGPGVDVAVADRGSLEGPAADAGSDGVPVDMQIVHDGYTSLPFDLIRPPAGDPVTPAELTAMTDRYLEMLEKTRYFRSVDERVHGWPKSDPQGRYWHGTWWSGIRITRTADKVTFLHPNDGSDNNGMRTGPVLEGVCYAYSLWQTPQLELLLRKLIRGLNAWVLAMQRQVNDPAGVLLTRAFYPASITSNDHALPLEIDYSLNHPGEDNGATEYVHIPQNPYWGDIWVKNKRSKDDIGHMLRAMATLSDCAPQLGAEGRAEYKEMMDNYRAWSRRVEDDAWSIATYDQAGNLWIPPITETLAHFYDVGNAECDAMIAIRLMGRGDPGAFACGNGVHPLELVLFQNAHNAEIARSFHLAAARQALDTGHALVAKELLLGLIFRLDRAVPMGVADALPDWMRAADLSGLINHAANAGVPLTARDVRYFHQLVEAEYDLLVNRTPAGTFSLFDAATPPGQYAFIPGGLGMKFRSLALALGSCASRYRNSTGSPLLDCARVAAFTP